MKTDSPVRFAPNSPVIFFWAVLSIAAASSPILAQDYSPFEYVEQALASSMPDRQRAALVLIFDWNPTRPQAEKLARHIETYLSQTSDEEGKVLALQAFGKLPVPAATLAPVLKAHLAGGSVPVRRAAASALANAAALATLGITGNAAITPDKPTLGITGNADSVGLVGGASTSYLWLRAQVETAIYSDGSFKPFSTNAQRLLPLCSIALNDPDDRVKRGGADGIRAIARAIADVIPDNQANTADNKFEPNELKVRLSLLSPAITSLNKEAPSLAKGLTAGLLETRIVATKAVDAVAQARNAARVNQRLDTPNLNGILEQSIPEDPLASSVSYLLPELGRRLRDDSPAERLLAMEAFEHLDDGARSQLDDIIFASTDTNLFVRWVACRSFGRMLPKANPNESERIVAALRDRVGDTDLDVRAAALVSVGKGGTVARSATDAVLNAVVKGDPDVQVLAIDTLEKIEADRAQTVPVVKGTLFSDSDRLRKAGIAFLGRAGKSAKEALPGLRRLLLDPDIEIRKEAAKALLAIEKEL